MARLVKFTGKIGLVGGTIYYTNSIGVWGDSQDTQRAYSTIYGLAAPYVAEVPVEVPELPRLTDITSSMKNYWNSGVLATSKFILESPQIFASLAKEGYDFVFNQINPPNENS
uniref:MICOS complex subunit MIC13 n=1 Tax=Riptortus pedestris TaxID=329032 RepID=R4WJQ6_RIPPE|nr:unkown protein [Riptortus pedestris]